MWLGHRRQGHHRHGRRRLGASARPFLLLPVAVVLAGWTGCEAPPSPPGSPPGSPPLSPPVSPPSAASSLEPSPPPSPPSSPAPSPGPSPQPSEATSPVPAPAPPEPPEPPEPDPQPAPAPDGSGAGSAVGDSDLYAFSCGDDESAVAASGAPSVTLGDSTIYVGGQQVTSVNQDPRVVRFDGGRQAWCRDDLERNGDDGRAYGLLWAPDSLYVVVSATGTQGDAAGDLRRFTRDGWLSTYSDASPGGGGGAKVAVVVRLDPATGDGTEGTWLTAVKPSDGRTNSLAVTGLALTEAGLVVEADAWYSPRGLDRRALSCSGDSPFATTYTLTSDLAAATSAEARGCS